MNFRINDLRNFIEVASCRTMREGAERLQITQPALSESIKRLEKDIGEVLFYRSRSGISLTPAGQEALRKGRVAIGALREIAGERTQADARIVSLGCHSVMGSYFLPTLFRALKNQNAVSLKLRHDLSRNIQLEIQQGRIDLGIVVNPVPSPDLVIRTIATDEFCVWHRPELAPGSNIFCDLSLNQTHSILRKWKNRSSEMIETESLELIARMANLGVGYGIAPRRAVNLLGFTRLREVPGSPTFKDSFALVHRPEFGKNELERYLLDQLRRSFG